MKKTLLLILENEIVELKGTLIREENKEYRGVEVVKIIQKRKLVVSGDADNSG